MGILFNFVTGTIFGVYVAQNYDVPNMKKLFNMGVVIAKHYEANYRNQSKVKQVYDCATECGVEYPGCRTRPDQ